ncbi:MAG: class I SAM-dependent methyltransferase, partial [Candidatus Kariarchaeaceae archaeon]|jgi:SAM-dependent methyltransferase
VDAIVEAGSKLALDVGSGPGNLVIELLKGGIPHVIGLDLSEDMNTVAKERLGQEDLSDRVTFYYGSFLDVDLEENPDAISLHRVLCCHPDREGMLAKSVSYNPEIITLCIPRDWKIVRALLGVVGIIAKLRSSFRPFVHTQQSINTQLASDGYGLISQHKGFWWVTSTYRRTGE